MLVHGYLSHLAIFVTILQIWPSSHQPIKVNGDKCIGPGMAIVQYHLRLILLNSNCSGRLWSGEHKFAIKIAGSDFYEEKVNTNLQKKLLVLIFIPKLAVWEMMSR